MPEPAACPADVGSGAGHLFNREPNAAMIEPDDNDIEWVPGEAVYLPEDTCWVADPDFLLPDSGVEGVLAMQYRGGDLFYLDGATRKWVNVEAEEKPTRRLKPVN